MFGNMTENLKKEFHEGISDTPISGIFEMWTGKKEPTKSYQPRPNPYKAAFRRMAVNAVYAMRAQRQGYDVERMLVASKVMQATRPPHMGPMGPDGSAYDMEMGM